MDLIRGASVAGVLKVIGALLAFGLSVILGRLLGAEATGVYFLALTTATIAATVGRYGLDSALLRHVAAHASSGNWRDVVAIHRSALAIGFTGSCLAAAVLYVGSDFLSVEVFSDENVGTPIRLFTLAILPLSLSILVSRSLLGLSKVRDGLLVFSIIPSATALLGTWWLATAWGTSGAIVAYVIAVLAALAYGWAAWRRALAGRDRAPGAASIASPHRTLLASGSPLLIGGLLQLVIEVSGTLMLGIWSTNADVAQFAIAWRTAALISFVLVAVNTIAQPKFAELYARGQIRLLATTAQRATVLMIVCAVPVLLFFIVSPGYVLGAFGSDFATAARPLQILSIGQFVNVATGSVGVLLVMSGHEREYRDAQVVAACTVLALGVLLIPEHGATGAAIAAAAALITQNALFGYFVWRRLGILTFWPGRPR